MSRANCCCPGPAPPSPPSRTPGWRSTPPSSAPRPSYTQPGKYFWQVSKYFSRVNQYVGQDPPGHTLVRAHGVQPRDGGHGHLVLQVLCTVYHTLYRTVLYCTLYCTVLYFRVDGRSKQVTAYHVRVTGGIDFI